MPSRPSPSRSPESDRKQAREDFWVAIVFLLIVSATAFGTFAYLIIK